MSYYCRLFRVVADDWQPQPPNAGRGLAAARGHHLTELAERDLRARLAAGDRPGVMLVAPERASAEPILPGGRITRPVFAWTLDATGAGAFMHAPHAFGKLWAADDEPDPVSDEYAKHGSVRLPVARLAELTVAPCLAPVADALRDRYGVPVIVGPGEDVPMPDVQPGPAAVLSGALPPEVLDQLWEWIGRQAFDPRVRNMGGQRQPGGVMISPPSWLTPWLYSAFQPLVDYFDLPVDAVNAQVVAYDVGECAREHVDNTPGNAKMLDTTISLSALLSEPGEDFTGGQLRVNGQPIDLHAGDVCGFTAATPHEVTPVESGERLVVIAFGEVAR